MRIVLRCPRCRVALAPAQDIALVEREPVHVEVRDVDMGGPCIAASDGAYADTHPSAVVEWITVGFVPTDTLGEGWE